jgi:hypothetical protein
MFPMGSYPQFSFVLRFFCPSQRRSSKPILLVTLLILLTFFLSFRISAQNKIVWSDQEKPIVEQLQGLRKLDDTGTCPHNQRSRDANPAIADRA